MVEEEQAIQGRQDPRELLQIRAQLAIRVTQVLRELLQILAQLALLVGRGL